MTYYHVPPDNVSIELQGRTYTIKCSKEEKVKLDRAVEILDNEMQLILQGHTHPSPEQLAVVAALNLAVKNDQLQGMPSEDRIHQDQTSINSMTEKCQTLLELVAAE
jgi:cell division protein ZapA (FtsZ GTPase activity inhibitor)